MPTPTPRAGSSAVHINALEKRFLPMRAVQRSWIILFVVVSVIVLLARVGSDWYRDDVENEPSEPKHFLQGTLAKRKDAKYQNEECVVDTEVATNYKTNDIWKQLNEQQQMRQYMHNLGYNTSSVPQPKISLFLVPHSHSDPGWLKTFLNYSLDTEKTLNAAVTFLTEHPDMTFTWTETSFFQKWWSNQNENVRSSIKRFLSNGQLEITSGSWVMTDEASPHFWSSIDNLIEGHQYLYKELGFIPKVSWSNDPFGYGSTVPFLFRKAGFTQLVIQRIHYLLKPYLSTRKALEFFWRQKWDEAQQHDMFTHVLPFGHYDVINSCGPDPQICCQFDFKRLTHYTCPGPMPVKITPANVAERAATLYDQYRKHAMTVRHNVVLTVLGDDFRYDSTQEFSQQYENYKMLFDYMNSRPEWNIEAKFGTFSGYFNALKQRAVNMQAEFPSLSGDFFPYSDWNEDYWTGYYTTRPYFKKLDRTVHGHIRGADIFLSLAAASRSSDMIGRRKRTLDAQIRQLRTARRDLALFQHHDAITGTSKPHVVLDYGTRLWKALLRAGNALGASAQLLLTNMTPEPNSEVSQTDDLSATVNPHQNAFLFQLNEKQDAYNALPSKIMIQLAVGQAKNVIIVNSLPYTRYELVRLHVTDPRVEVYNQETKRVLAAQINPAVLPGGMLRIGAYELAFVVDVAALAMTKLTLRVAAVQPESTTIASLRVKSRSVLKGRLPTAFTDVHVVIANTFSVKTNHLRTIHDTSTGLLKGVFYPATSEYRPSAIEIWSYQQTGSGAYLFRPQLPPKPFDLNVTAVVIVEGPVVADVHSVGERVHHVATLRQSDGDDPLGQIVYLQNTVDLRNLPNMELVMRIYTDIVNNNTFFTDSNGFQFMQRRFYPLQKIETNYYPMTGAAFLEDNKSRFTLFSGQPHGVTNLDNGAFEIMLDRILSTDDYKGLGFDSIVRDNVPTISDFRLLFEELPPIQKSSTSTAVPYLSRLGHQTLQALTYPPIILHQMLPEDSVSSYSALRTPFPCDMQLLNARYLDQSTSSPLLLLLHRTGESCLTAKVSTSNCVESTNQKGLEDFLAALNAKRLRPTSLSGVYDSESTLNSANVRVNTMDIEAFKIER